MEREKGNGEGVKGIKNQKKFRKNNKINKKKNSSFWGVRMREHKTSLFRLYLTRVTTCNGQKYKSSHFLPFLWQKFCKYEKLATKSAIFKQ
ncbi:MAG: hypothetical protein ABW185_17900, partial [Sedimenticola sp.]